jgi:Tol biopolymer transport system component/DNA-binding winged helix-turn-helix (wHTH) protein
VARARQWLNRLEKVFKRPSNISQTMIKSVMSRPTKRFYEFDCYRIDLTERSLLREGELVPLTQKAFEVLLALVERRGGIVSKEELMAKVWPDAFVVDSNLTQNIYTLRKALGQAPDGQGYIVTVPRRGYRFTGSLREPVEEEAEQSETASIKFDVDLAVKSSADVIAAPAPTPINEPVEEKLTIGESAPHKSSRAVIILSAAVLLVAAASIAIFIIQKKRGGAPSRMSVSALTTAGNVLTAAISSDGSYVAYATSENAARSALWIEQVSTSTRRQIIPAAEHRYYALTFSPDSGHVYYVADTKESPRRSIYRVSALGGPSKLLFEDINAAVSFSPDGSKIALRRAVDTRRAIIISVADADGRSEKEIASIQYPELFYDPSWSPDGKVIACAAGNPSGVADMYVAGIRAGDWAMKTISARRWKWIGQMAWLDNSRDLALVAQENSAAPRQVWLLDSMTGEARRITNDTTIYNRLSLAAKSSAIAALSVKQVSNVWVIPANGDGGKQVTLAAGGYRGELSWTPDGKIVYESEAGAAPAISVMEADGSGARLLTGEMTGRAYIGWAKVSPDGRYIVFTSDLKGERHIWRMNIDGGNPIQLTNGGGEDNPYCSPDGRWVFYTKLENAGANLPSIGRVSIDGGEMKSLTEAFTANPSVSPDGRFFACLYAEGPGPFPWNIAVYPVEGPADGPIDGKRPIKIFSLPVQTQTVRWTPDGRGLSYHENPASGASKLWIQPLDGGEPKLFAEFESDRIFGFDWSRDGKYLACVRGIWATNVVLIKGFRD